MMALAQFSVGSDNAIKNITSEVVRDCAKIDIHIEEPVVSLAVRLLCLDPANGLQLDEHYDRSDLEEFVAKCVAKFQDRSNSSIKTLHMQWLGMEYSIDPERIISTQETIMRTKLRKLTNEILSAPCKQPEDRERVMKKMAVDVIMYCSLGSPANQQLCIEVVTALKSVMSPEDMCDFGAAKRDARLDTLFQLRDIVCGIYIFNKDSGFCGEDIVDVSTLVTSGHATTLNKLSIAVDEIEHRTNLLPTVVAKYRNELGEKLGPADAVFEVRLVLPRGVLPAAESDLVLLQNMLIMNRQHGVYLRRMQRALGKLKADIDIALKAFHAKLKMIRETVQYKTAIPTDQIFPHFVELAQCWHRLQNQLYILTEINVVNERLMQLTDDVAPWENLAFDLLADSPIASDAERQQRDADTADGRARIVSDNADVKVIDYAPKMRLENGGFCTTTLINSGGLLWPSRPEAIGVCVYGGRNYAFRSAAAARVFVEHPKRCVFAVVECTRSHPELIVLLDCFDVVQAHRKEFHGVTKSSAATAAAAAGGGAHRAPVQRRSSNAVAVQTELHPGTAQFDKDYDWNVWDRRRRAIQLANIMRSRTHATQTNVGYGMFGVHTQTSNPRDDAAQTRQNRGTAVPPPKRYVRRTRGSDVETSRTVQLTEYVEDDVH